MRYSSHSPHSGVRKGRSSVSGTRSKDLISIYVTGDGELLSHLIAGKTEAQRGSVMRSGSWLAGADAGLIIC